MNFGGKQTLSLQNLALGKKVTNEFESLVENHLNPSFPFLLHSGPGAGCGQGVGSFHRSPGDSNVQPSLRTPVPKGTKNFRHVVSAF